MYRKIKLWTNGNCPATRQLLIWFWVTALGKGRISQYQPLRYVKFLIFGPAPDSNFKNRAFSPGFMVRLAKHLSETSRFQKKMLHQTWVTALGRISQDHPFFENLARSFPYLKAINAFSYTFIQLLLSHFKQFWKINLFLKQFGTHFLIDRVLMLYC